jgi:hypothetical protein
MTNEKQQTIDALSRAARLAQALTLYFDNLADDRNEYPDEEFADGEQVRWATGMRDQMTALVFDTLGLDESEIDELLNTDS